MKISLLSTTFLFFCLASFSQQDSTVRNFPDRYKLDIPDEWRKPKLIEAITDILPKTLDEYIDSNKQFCMDCTAGQTVMLIIDKPFIKPTEETYRFRAALGLFDSTGKELIELLLVSPQEIHQIYDSPRYPREPLSLASGDVIGTVIRDREGNIISVVKIPLNPAPLINNIPSYDKRYPSLYDLINIAEKRVYEIREILSKVPTD